MKLAVAVEVDLDREDAGGLSRVEELESSLGWHVASLEEWEVVTTLDWE